MTLSEFIQDKEILTDPKDIKKFFVKETGDLESIGTGYYAVHVYGSCYNIDELSEGMYSLTIANMQYDGTLSELEEVLFKWAYIGDD